MPHSTTEAFRTHANYMRSFSFLACDGEFDRRRAFERLAERIDQSGSLPEAPNPAVDADAVRRIIEHGWATELLMSVGESLIDDDELVRISNNWSAVQCYYSTYHATQALAVAKGFARPDSHPKTQRQFASFWAGRALDIAPWTLAAEADGFRNVPAAVAIDDQIHAWSGCNSNTCWSLVCKALRTTRADFVDEALKKGREAKRVAARKEWRADEHNRLAAGRRARVEPRFHLPRLSPGEKASIEEKTRPSTLIDYLYRIRIKTNYEDSAMFTDGPEDAITSSEVRGDLCLIASLTLMLHETEIAGLVGAREFLRWADEWVDRKLPIGLRAGLAERVNVLRQLWP